MATCDPDWETVRKFRFTSPQMYTDLCISHLSRLLDLSVDQLKTFFKKATCYSSGKKSRELVSVVTHQMAVEIEYLIHQLKKDCNLKTRLLFRKPSSKARSKHLRMLLAERRFAEIELGCFTPCDFADVLKRILRDPREPLLTSVLYVIYCQVEGLVKPEMEGNQMRQAFEKQRWALCILFLMLPEDNYFLMQELLFMLHETHSLREHNNMNAHSLAVCLAPSLVFPREFTMKEFHRNSTDAVSALKFMIENAPLLFVVPPQFVKDVKIQQTKQLDIQSWHDICPSNVLDQAFCRDSDSSSVSSPEYMESHNDGWSRSFKFTSSTHSELDCTLSDRETTLGGRRISDRETKRGAGTISDREAKRVGRTLSDREAERAHSSRTMSDRETKRCLANCKSWSYHDLRPKVPNAGKITPTVEFDENPSVLLFDAEEPLPIVSKSRFFQSLASDEPDSDLPCNRADSFWSRRKTFLRKLFPGKDPKTKSLSKKKRRSWFSLFADKEDDVKMPPGGHAGSEKGPNGIRSYRPSAIEVRNQVDRSRRDSNHNLVPERLKVQSLGKVESRFGSYHSLVKSLPCSEEDLLLVDGSERISNPAEDISPRKISFDRSSFENDSWIRTLKTKSPAARRRCTMFERSEEYCWQESTLEEDSFSVCPLFTTPPTDLEETLQEYSLFQSPFASKLQSSGDNFPFRARPTKLEEERIMDVYY